MASHQMLRVGIVGAGIAGLAAALGLRRAGHDVEVFQKSMFKNEVGAAVLMPSNAVRVLDAWGFDFEKAGATENGQYRMLQSDFSPLFHGSMANNQALYGYKWLAFHRVDLHKSLREMAESSCGVGKPVSIRLGSQVIALNVETGVLTLNSGEEIQKDLVVLADGGQCRFGEAVTGQETPLQMLGRSAIRCLIPMDKISRDPVLWTLWRNEVPGFYCLADLSVKNPTFCVTYPCRTNSVLNIALLHDTREEDMGKEDWNSPCSLEALFETISNFHPAWKRLFSKADDVRLYNIGLRGPHDRIVNGKAVLIGDAAHVMLPSNAQGAAMAIEDAAALEVLFSNLNPSSEDDDSKKSTVQNRLRLFQTLRLPRSSVTQILSNMNLSSTEYPAELLRKYYEGPLPPLDNKLKRFGLGQSQRDFFNAYDIFAEARTVLSGGTPKYFGHMSQGYVGENDRETAGV